MIWLRTPPIEFGRCYDPMLCANVLGLTQTDMLEIVPQLVSAGNPTVLIAVRNKEAVDRAWLDMGGIEVLKGQDREPVIVFVFAPRQRELTRECSLLNTACQKIQRRKFHRPVGDIYDAIRPDL